MTVPARMKFGVFGWPSTGQVKTRPWPWNVTWRSSNGSTCWASTRPISANTTALAGRPSAHRKCLWPPLPSARAVSSWAPGLRASPSSSIHGCPSYDAAGSPDARAGHSGCRAWCVGLRCPDVRDQPERQREMMDESLGVIVRLFESTTPLTVKSDWFELNEAVLQLRPYQQPFPIAVASVQSPAGVIVAGKYGAGVLSLSIPRDTVRRPVSKSCGPLGKKPPRSMAKPCAVRTGVWSCPCISPKAVKRPLKMSALAVVVR